MSAPIGEVQNSAELDRILRIPRRRWTDAQAEALADRLTAALKTPAGTQRLRPAQAVALAEIGLYRGAFVPIPTGGGKTLVQFLAGAMIPGVLRPMGLMPAHLIEEKEAEMREYRKHWKIPAFLRLDSYQGMSRVSKKDFLFESKPDLVAPDEGHMLANPDAGRTKRVRRYLESAPGCSFVCLTGTPTDTSLRQCAHLMKWSLRRLCPVPVTHLDLDEWYRALDLDVVPNRRLAPGALERLRSPDASPWEDIRETFQEKLRDTPGVIMYSPPDISTPIEIRSHVLPLCPAQVAAFADLRKDWKTPDGLLCRDGVEIWRHAREISLGFYSVWTPRPPEDWREARSAWARECRAVLGSNRRELDTEGALVLHLLAHPEHYPEAAAALEEWTRTEPSFTPNPTPFWISDAPLDWVAAWAGSSPGLIWLDRPAVGARLSERHGIPYYGEAGIDVRTGRHVRDHRPSEGSIALARRANDSGRNLQAWNRNLILDIMKSGKDWQQLIARTHREGQNAPRVTVDALFGSIEDIAAFWAATERGEYAVGMFGHAQKLLTADKTQVITYPPDTEEPRWRKTK